MLRAFFSEVYICYNMENDWSIYSMKRIILILLSVTLCLGFTGCSKPKPELKDDIHIFYTSDVHCGVSDNMGFARLKALVDDDKAEHPYVVLVDCGDYLQGGTIGSISKGEQIIEIMNAMNYDVATIGNHEFDYGMDRLKELMGMAEFDIVACNSEYTGSKTDVFENTPKYVIKDFDGIKVAFIGVITPESLISSTPSYFMEDGKFVYDFGNGDDGLKIAERVQKSVDAARKEGADYVIALTHLGTGQEYEPYDAITLIRNTNGIDAVLDGHAHAEIIGDTYLNKDGKEIVLSSVGTKMANVGELFIGKDGTIETMLISEYDREDEEIKALIAREEENLNQLLQRKLSHTDFEMSITDENGIRLVRNREVGLADLVADVWRDYLGTDVVIVNGGAVRKTVKAGDITYQTVLDVQPFMNSLSSCFATGQQILDALEFGSRYTESQYTFDEKAAGEFGGFLQVSGLKYTIDTSIPSPVQVDADGMLTGFNGERRVKDVYILENGEYVALDPGKIYTVGGPDYLMAHMGDGNTVFKDCEYIILAGPTDIDVLAQYFSSIASVDEKYSKPEGRITVE